LKRLVIKGGTVITPLEEIVADVEVRDGKVTAVAANISVDGAEVVEARGKFVAPGTIDLHCQGHEGRDLWERSYEAANAVSVSLVKYGVTGITPTTSGFAEYLVPLVEAIAGAVDGAQFLGLHSEGPFVNPDRPGAIDKEGIAPLSMDALKRLVDACDGRIAIMTIAPELPGALEAISFLRERGIRPSLGHSNATYAEANAGFDAGAVRVTHLFNAMTAFADRADGGLAAAALARKDVAVEVVCDCVHLHPAILRMVGAAKGTKLTSAITDSVKVAGLAAGRFSSGGHGKEVFVDKRGNPPRLADGTIAGSGLSMDQGVRNLVRFAGFSRAEAFTMAAYAPAAVLGLLGQKGEIKPGRDADICLYSSTLEVERTYVAGELKYTISH